MLATFAWSCQAAGGLAGAISAAFLTQDNDPKVCFLIYAFLGLVLLFGAVGINKEIEVVGNRSENQENAPSFRSELGRSCTEIGQALQVKEIYSILAFMALYALLIPSFASFDYYFMLDVVGISQFEFSMLCALHYVCMFIGSHLFRLWLTDFEVRTLTILEVLLGLLCAPFTMLFATRQNLAWGISDGFIIIFSDVIVDVFSMCLIVLPMIVLFAKITPCNIEATCFAMLACLYNFRSNIRG